MSCLSALTSVHYRVSTHATINYFNEGNKLIKPLVASTDLRSHEAYCQPNLRLPAFPFASRLSAALGSMSRSVPGVAAARFITVILQGLDNAA